MNIALIVAAGRGTRLDSAAAKQFLPLGGVPILSRTLRPFEECPAVELIILVLAPRDVTCCRHEIIAPMQMSTPLVLVAGGGDRQASVRNGLAAVDNGDHWIIIHDGVRPFVTPAQIETCLDTARATGACILATQVVDTIKQVDGQGTIRRTRSREGLWLAQTPQVFRLADIRRAHEEACRASIRATDDAALVERIGIPVNVALGSRRNIKITTAEDLELAEAILGMNDRAGP